MKRKDNLYKFKDKRSKVGWMVILNHYSTYQYNPVDLEVNELVKTPLRKRVKTTIYPAVYHKVKELIEIHTLVSSEEYIKPKIKVNGTVYYLLDYKMLTDNKVVMFASSTYTT